MLSHASEEKFGKVAEVTLGFWLIKVLATTLGETGGDAVTMSMNLGYTAGTLLFAALFAIAVSLQIRAERFNAFRFWAVIIATTTVGTTLADLVDRSLGIGYLGGTLILVCALAASLTWWYRAEGSISVARMHTRRAELFYWLTILFSQTLGTALGDWVADDKGGLGLGYGGGAMVFGAALVLVAALHFWSSVNKTALFWAAFILTRPLGATVGDFLDKPLDAGGLAWSRYTASGALLAAILLCILVFPRRAERID